MCHLATSPALAAKTASPGCRRHQGRSPLNHWLFSNVMPLFHSQLPKCSKQQHLWICYYKFQLPWDPRGCILTLVFSVFPSSARGSCTFILTAWYKSILSSSFQNAMSISFEFFLFSLRGNDTINIFQVYKRLFIFKKCIKLFFSW